MKPEHFDTQQFPQIPNNPEKYVEEKKFDDEKFKDLLKNIAREKFGYVIDKDNERHVQNAIRMVEDSLSRRVLSPKSYGTRDSETKEESFLIYRMPVVFIHAPVEALPKHIGERSAGYRIISFLKVKETEIVGPTGLCPPEFKVFFELSERRHGASYCTVTHKREKTIEIHSTIDSIEGLFSLMHEIGHAILFEQISDEDIEKRRIANLDIYYHKKDGTDASKSIFIQEERRVNAFALEKMKTLFRGSEIDQNLLRVLAHSYMRGHDAKFNMEGEEQRRLLL